MFYTRPRPLQISEQRRRFRRENAKTGGEEGEVGWLAERIHNWNMCALEHNVPRFVHKVYNHSNPKYVMQLGKTFVGDSQGRNVQ